MIIRVIRSFLNKIGLDVVRYRPPLESNLNIDEYIGYEFEQVATTSINIVKNNTMLSKRRLVTLYQQVIYCEENNIQGSFVECGVWKGGAVGLMALANMHSSDNRRHLHLFDSFEGICYPDIDVDGESAMKDANMVANKTLRKSGSLESVANIYDHLGGIGMLSDSKALLEKVISYPENYIHYHKGWFQNTLPTEHELINKIAILRLDGDWYASTKICLQYLYNKVVKGGIVIVDDYGTYEGCKKAFDEFMADNNEIFFLSTIDSDSRYFIKQ